MVPIIEIREDLAPGDIGGGASGLTRLQRIDMQLDGCVYDDHGTWRIHATEARMLIQWGVRNTGYQEPWVAPNPAATITCANATAAIAEMAAYHLRRSAGQNWHMREASRAHERDHVDWFERRLTDTWPPIEAQLEALALGSTATMTRMHAEGLMDDELTVHEGLWWAAQGPAPEPPAYAAGQAVLNIRIGEIQAWATANCP